MQQKATVVYKTIDASHPLSFDAYIDQGALDSLTESSKTPAVLYFHGGGLVCGDRASFLPSWLIDRVLDLGIIFVSVDHRLLPAATAHDIVHDIQHLLEFLRDEGISGLAKTLRVDTERVIVAGSSAGGLLAYLAGYHCSPKPRAVVSCFGMGGDLLMPTYYTAKTQPFYMGQPLQDPSAFQDFLYPFKEGKPSAIDNSPMAFNPPSRRQQVMTLYTQLGTWLDYYTGAHAPSLSQTLLLASQSGVDQNQLGEHIPVEHRTLFPQIFIGKTYPPTLIIHGNKDTAVPIEESRKLTRTLEKAGVTVEFIEVDGQEHFFDIVPTSAGKFEEEFDKVKHFISQWLSA